LYAPDDVEDSDAASIEPADAEGTGHCLHNNHGEEYSADKRAERAPLGPRSSGVVEDCRLTAVHR
jgi:hypothetical protein